MYTHIGLHIHTPTQLIPRVGNPKTKVNICLVHSSTEEKAGDFGSTKDTDENTRQYVEA